MYLGGNGFYWRVALNPEFPGAVEIRRGETGIRAWAAEPGEYYNAFDGGYGGLWRNNGRSPAPRGSGIHLTGRLSRHLLPAPAGFQRPPRRVDLRGHRGRGPRRLRPERRRRGRLRARPAGPETGIAPQALVLACSEEHDDTFILVPEEMLTHRRTRAGVPARDLIRSELVFFETPNGGAVFSVGSISFCGSLPHNDFNNNISRMVDNVLRRFRSD